MMKKRSSVAMSTQSCKPETANIDWELPQTSSDKTVAYSKTKSVFECENGTQLPASASSLLQHFL